VAFSFLSRIRNNVLTTGVGFAIGGAASAAFEPPLRELSYELESLVTNRVLSPAELAEAVIRGLYQMDSAAEEAAKTGYNAERFQTLVNLSGNPPGVQELLELWRRGKIDEGDVDRGIKQGRTRTEWLPALKSLRYSHLTPNEAASYAARGLIDDDYARHEARIGGLEPERYEILRRAAGNPPGPGETLQLLNRGEFTEAEARAALHDAGIRAEYVDPILGLRNQIPGAQDVVRFALREVYDAAIVAKYRMLEGFPEEADADARKAGIDRDTMLKYWAAHWTLPSRTQGYEMLHRGIITEAELTQLLRADDVMPGWISNLIDLAYSPLTRVDVRRMYRDGVLNKAEVVRSYKDLGYNQENATRLAEWVSTQKTITEREFTKAEIVQLYEARTMPKTEAEASLTQLGYDAQEIEYILALADYRRDKARRTKAINVTKGRYLARQITDVEASNRLDEMGVPATERDDLIDEWSWILQESPKMLTEAQMRGAWNKGLVSEGDYIAHLAALGYDEKSRGLLVSLYRKKSATVEP
jgi:hypothetical protein